MEENSNWKKLAYIIGGATGLVAGLAAAFIFIRTREEAGSDESHMLTSGDGVKIGMGVVSLLRMIAEGGPRK